MQDIAALGFAIDSSKALEAAQLYTLLCAKDGYVIVAPLTRKLGLVADVVSRYLRRNSDGADQIGNDVDNVTRALTNAEKHPLGAGDETTNGSSEPAEQAKRAEPAVSVRASVQPDYLVCLVCGSKVKTLKRHLMSAHALTPDQYPFSVPLFVPTLTKPSTV